MARRRPRRLTDARALSTLVSVTRIWAMGELATEREETRFALADVARPFSRRRQVGAHPRASLRRDHAAQHRRRCWSVQQQHGRGSSSRIQVCTSRDATVTA